MAVPARVLIIEDDPGIAEMIEMMLTADGCTTEVVVDGSTALDRLSGPPPDIAVLDVMLPHTDGLDILRTIRSDERWSKVPVVVVTARGSDDQVWDGWSAGADYYMVKPFDPNDLRATVRRLLEQDAAP